MPGQRLVLLALIAPIIGVGIVLWFLLPGSISGISYTPSTFARAARLQPVYWTKHAVTLRGYMAQDPCLGDDCSRILLTDTPAARTGVRDDPAERGMILVLMQHESGWHTFMRHLFPGLLATPFPGTPHAGRAVTITGTLQRGYTGIDLPVLVPNAL